MSLAGWRIAVEDGKKPACEQSFAREAKLGVTQTPALALPSPHLAAEVDGDRPPVAKWSLSKNRGGRSILTLASR